MKNVESPEEFENELKKALTKFMEENKTFNVQGSWTGEDGITVSVLVDFGIEDRDQGTYYVGSVSARYSDNLEKLHEEGAITPPEMKGATTAEEVKAEQLIEILGESDTFMDAENAMINAISEVFDTGRDRLRSRPEASDIDLSSSIPIMFGEWKTTSEVDFRRD